MKDGAQVHRICVKEFHERRAMKKDFWVCFKISLRGCFTEEKNGRDSVKAGNMRD